MQTSLTTAKTTLSTDTVVQLVETEDGEHLSVSVQDGNWIRFIRINIGEGDRELLIDLLKSKKAK